MNATRRPQRCAWVKSDSAEIAYHDTEWGVPVRDDRKLFEFMILEGAQAGLSWSTVLVKRGGYRVAFDAFDAQTIAGYGQTKLGNLLNDPGIVRNRLKIASAVNNARRFLEVTDEFGTFADYLWSFTANRVIHNRWPSAVDVPATTILSDTLSRDLKQRGFTFVGSTICYAYMQAVGLVNDHTTDCFRYAQIKRMKPR